MGARRVPGAPVPVAFPVLPGLGGHVAVPTVHPLGGARLAVAVHLPGLLTLFTAGVRTLAPLVGLPDVLVERGRCGGGGGGGDGVGHRGNGARRLVDAHLPRGRRRAHSGHATRRAGHRVAPRRVLVVAPAHHASGVHALSAGGRARRPLGRFPRVRADRGRLRRSGRLRRRGRGRARRGRPARLHGGRFLEPFALIRRQQRALVVLALHLSVLVSTAARDVTLQRSASHKTNRINISTIILYAYANTRIIVMYSLFIYHTRSPQAGISVHFELFLKAF